jgi:hypothetical protein
LSTSSAVLWGVTSKQKSLRMMTADTSGRWIDDAPTEFFHILQLAFTASQNLSVLRFDVGVK